MTIGELVETLIGLHSKKKISFKEDNALCEACNILDKLPRMADIETVKLKLEEAGI